MKAIDQRAEERPDYYKIPVSLVTSATTVSPVKPITVIGNNPKFIAMLSEIEISAKDDAVKIILLCGESGTGKDVIAGFVHRSSQRQNRPFIAINCANISEGLTESELFGHEKGAFTGAVKRQIGKFELTDGGILFLNEINSTKPEFQAKLLKFLDDGKIRRVGGTADIDVDVRIIFASNESPSDLIKQGKLRNDFYQRISMFEFTMPPLRDRQEDIIPLANYFLDKFKKDHNKPNIKEISKGVLQKLKTYHFKDSNVRGLQNIIKYMVVYADDNQKILTSIPDQFKIDEIPFSKDLEVAKEGSSPDLDKLLGLKYDEFQRAYFGLQIKKHNGNISLAANSLGLNRTTLHSRLNALGVDPARFRQ